MSYPDLQGKRVLVTGASGGLGAAMAKAYARSGARVMVHYFSRRDGAERTLASIHEAGGEGALCRADLRSEKAIERLMQETVAAWGGLDVLMNNAGVVLKARVLDAGAEYWDDTLSVNLRAPYLLSRLAARQMIAQGQGGVILHNSSIHARNSVQNFSAYAASKAGLEALAKVQALEWAAHGIRVNCVAPGVVPVERTAEALAAAEPQWLPHLPLGRYGEVKDIAELTMFLSSARAGWITGQAFIADGGMSARMDMPRRPAPELPPRPSPLEED